MISVYTCRVCLCNVFSANEVTCGHGSPITFVIWSELLALARLEVFLVAD